jgi:hypothetical protein
MFTAEQKSQLAKLMATENLTIQHQKMQTAKFDPKNRVLYLPIWQNMSGFMYDLLCGHEVGHALYTPADGWHDVATDTTKGKNYKSFLNVVEDARIEKKIKRRYPGLKTSFQKGYQDLIEKDFFGIKNRDVNEMSFIDRLNIYTKSQYVATWINFSAQEMTFVRKVENLETWEDVLHVTDEIYEYCKNEQQELEMKDFEYEFDENGDEIEIDPYDEQEGEAEGDESEGDADADGDGDSQNENDEGNKGKSSKDGEEGDDDNSTDTVNRDKNSSESFEDQYSPSCETDDNFRRNETMLLDEKCKDYLYVNIPKPLLQNIITPAKRVHEILTEEFKAQMSENNIYNMKPKFNESDVTLWVNEFKSKNERYIGLLAKEFEMRKAAKAFSKSKISDTGDIDINKLSSYKFDDNIFRKVMLTPKGKNHGLVLLLDKSGSMSNNMAGSIEQILILTLFCRKVNIPFIVYGFGDSVRVRSIDLNKTTSEIERCFEENENNIAFRSVFLREYLNSKMSNVEFSKAIRNMIMIKKSYEKSAVFRPDSEDLSNTPLTQALVATAEIMKKFRKDHNLDLTSLVIVHDGDADWCNDVWQTKEVEDYRTHEKTRKLCSRNFSTYDNNVIIADKTNKLQFKMTSDGRSDTNNIILNWFRKVTESKVFGFYLVANQYQGKAAINRYYCDKDGKTLEHHRFINYTDYIETGKKLVKQFKSEKFVQSFNPGYDSFFIVSGGNDLITENDELEIEGNITSSKLKSAFMKFNKKKAINRVLVSRFITGIAA